MDKQCLDVQQMKHLQELWLDTSNASMYWISYNGISVSIPSNFHLPTSDNDYVICDAYTLQDVLKLIPQEIKPAEKRYWLRIDLADECLYYYHETIDLRERRDKTFSYYGEELIDAAYSMLCWCIENGYVKTEKEGLK